MQITLYNMTSSNNTIGKVKETPLALNINMVGDFDLGNPIIRLSKTNFYSGSFNYIYFNDLGRYYFIDDIKTINSKVIELYLEIDVLETYKTEILNSKARYHRNLKNGDFINSNIDYSTLKKIDKYFSNIILNDNENSIIFTTLEV